jgi:hypothetical protein
MLAYSQIAIALKLRHCAPSSARTPLRLLCPVASPATSPPRAPATSPWTGHPERPPAKLTPPPYIPTSAHALPPFHRRRTGPPTKNRRGTSPEDGFSPSRTASPPPRHFPPNVVPPLLTGTWARAHGVVPARPPLVGRLGHLPARARPRSAGPKFPPTQLAGNPFSFSFFHFFFLFSCIYAYIDILCTKSSLNKL